MSNARSAEIQDAIHESVQEVRETLSAEFETIQTILSDQSEQIGRLHESVTGVQGGPGGSEAPFSLADIGCMLAGLHIIFEPQLKAKAFELFDEEANRLKMEGQDKGEFAEIPIKMAASIQLGVLPRTLTRFYQEWKTLRPESR